MNEKNYHTFDDDIAGIRNLVASIFEQAIKDLEGDSVRERIEALEFFKGNGFKFWCLAIGYSKREIKRARKKILKNV